MKALEVVDRVKGIIEPILERAGLEAVEVEYRREPIGMVLRVFIDRPEGIDINACADASATIGAELERAQVIESDYRLEVSSPGVERPLVKPAHFQRFVGHVARVRMAEPREGRKKFSGRITEANEEGIVLVTDVGPRKLLYKQIAKANLVHTDW